MAGLVGVVLALLVALFAWIVGLDRDRAFYPTVLAVVASYYDLFAVMGGSMQAILAESLVTVVFLIANLGVPAWWPPFCLAYDVTVAAWLALLLRRSGNARAGARVN